MRVVLVAGLALASISFEAAAQPSAPDRQLAADHFRQGQSAQAAGDYRAAIAAYEQAHARVPHPNTLFNIAVCYEALAEWELAAAYYERYLAEPGDHPDASSIEQKIVGLRARAAPPASLAPEPSAAPTVTPAPVEPPAVMAVAPVRRSRVHVGLSYGLGFGDAPTERYLGYGGIHIAERLELDVVLGKFGKNDLAIGAQGRLLLDRLGPIEPFGRGAITIGYAAQDASPSADSRFPFGLEVGGGLRFGARGRFELGALARWTRGGFDMTSTIVDSYVNDTFAVAIDLGFAFDLPDLAQVRTAGP